MRRSTWKLLVVAPVLASSSVVGAARVAVADSPVAASYVPVAPCRLLDTRATASPLGTGQTLTLQVAGECAVPEDSSAVALTITAVDTAAAGFLTVWPADRPQPLASTIAWGGAGEVRANGTLVGLSADGEVSVFVNSPTHVVVDVSGAFVPASTATAGRFVATTPTRLLDTRTTARPSAGDTVRVQLPDEVDADATAVALTITTTDASGPGFFTAFAAGDDRPTASVLNTTTIGQTVAATAIVPVDGNGVAVFTQRGDHIIVDFAGWFTGASADPTDDGLFVPISPTRVLDTRTAGIPLYTGGSLSLVTGGVVGGEVGDASAIVANVTSIESLGDGFVTAYPSSTERPLASTLNYVRGETVANMAVVATSTIGASVYANRLTQLVVDVTGWFTGTPLPSTGSADVNAPPPLAGCPATERAAVADKMAQRFWLCRNGVPVTDALPMTTGGLGYGLPPVGSYRVFTKLAANRGIHGEYLQRFVAFYTTPRGNRIAFHEVVNQRPDTVGDLAMRGASSGCFRVRRDDSWLVWDFLQIGDPVVVVTP